MSNGAMQITRVYLGARFDTIIRVLLQMQADFCTRLGQDWLRVNYAISSQRASLRLQSEQTGSAFWCYLYSERIPNLYRLRLDPRPCDLSTGQIDLWLFLLDTLARVEGVGVSGWQPLHDTERKALLRTLKRPGAIEKPSAEELQVLEMRQNGLNNAKVARQLYMTVSGVKKRINRALCKLDCSGNIEKGEKVCKARGWL